MKIYDKAVWHIDGGEKTSDVVNRFKVIFKFLDEKGLLNDDGKETLEYCMDSSVSLNSRMVNKEGKMFLDAYYDDVLSHNPIILKKNLYVAYKKFKSE